MNNNYIPAPIPVDNIDLDADLIRLSEIMAENSHELWAQKRLSQGWTYGEKRDNQAMTHPCLVPYSELPESEKQYDRRTSLDTLKLMKKMGCIFKKI